MTTNTRRKGSARPSASAVAVPWGQLLDALLMTAHLSRVTEEALALLRRLPPLPADMAAASVRGTFINRPVTSKEALAQIRKWRGKAGGAFAMFRWVLNPHREYQMNFVQRNFDLVALGQDDGESVLVLNNHLSLRAEPRSTNWSPDTMFLILKKRE